ncbi:MAG: tRNA (N(6)-L-threonylcarbamoyladenosine(37)-C(2))-methylthiotransferase MtaB [Firmicutes bacterium HGW-Firmicutes-10]|jgi:threonylcarbamoyladenosine tRNA methylthiotransferase MtaB|nr:MAG: tRNA (N(6)-L-threonylcarbamoyladenosine(37)-C(2))-methylthiotransferase MtaB [Firmicutes bacterium HGW-Firmicutes-10]
MKTFAIATLGCKVNTFESESYIESLKNSGYQQVDFKDAADIYIINTCSVTNTAASKSRQKIHQAIRQNGDAMICVVGCYVQTNQKDLHEIERIDLLIGAKHKSRLLEYINQGQGDALISDQRNLTFESLPLKHYSNQTRAFLKIQDGCDQFCSYCIIPYARGNERSASCDDLIEMAKGLVSNGHKEIVLSGIHIGRYGKDGNEDLTYLLKRLLEDVAGLERIRLSSIEVTEITLGLLDLMASSDKIVRHLHIPLQSGCDTVLKRMNRPYTTKEFYDRIQSIRQRFDLISISTDIIVGFPGESEEEFLTTMDFVEQCRFSFMHVFPYSMRANTVAAQLSSHLDANTKKERAQRLIAASSLMKARYEMQFVNQEVLVLFESYQNGLATGHSGEYVLVSVPSDESLNNQCHRVCITHHKQGRNYGVLVKKAVES